MAEVNQSRSGGIGFVGLLTILFVGLKLTGYITWSWWWVLSPLWISVCLFLLILVAAIPAIGLLLYFKEQRQLDRIRRNLLSLIIAALLLAAPLPIARADCRQFFVKQQVVAVPVVAYPQVYYAAGRDIEAEALAAKVAKLVTAQLRQELSTSPAKQTAPPSLLAQACAKCHSGATPKANLTIDGTTAMDCHSVLASIRAVASGKMPQGAKLTAEQKGRVLDELLALEQPADRPPPAPTPDLQ